MSLVNLAHVCSHLQNASLARLGLTPIPYTKLHLSVALLLHRQGFLSQVKLGGLSPPASCFGNGPSDNNRISSHLLTPAQRNPFTPEAALEFKIRNKATKEALQQHGFPSDAVDFAEEQIMMSYDDLVNDGWAARAVRFVLKVRKDIRNRQANALTTVFGEDSGARQFAEVPEGYDPKKDRDLEEDEDFEGEENAAQRKENHDFANRVKYEFLATLTDAQRALYDETSYLKEGAIWKGRNDAQVSQHKFEYATLQAFAGPAKRRSANYIEREGVTLNVMGLEVTKQPITFAKPEYADPDGLDDEGVVTQANRASRRLWLGLKYHDSMPVLSKLKLISKPTKRIWLSHSDLSRVIRGQEAGEVKGLRQIGEIMVVSTDRGIMEARDCVERRIGGQPLMRVW